MLAPATIARTLLIAVVVVVGSNRSHAQEEPTDEGAKPEAKAPEIDQDRVAELTELILAKPFEAKNYRLRAIEYAKGEAWNEAAADYQKMVEINPAKSQLWQQAASFLVLAEDEKKYREFCQKMLERFGDSEDQGDLERTPKVCVLAPRPVGDMDKMKQLAEAAVAASTESYWSCYHPRTLALVHYRRKEYAQTMLAITKSDRLNLEFEERKFDDIEVSNRAIEALCLIRRGNLEEGKALLAKATPILKAKMADRDAFYEDEFWHDWIIAKILHDEAHKLIEAGGMGEVKWGDERRVSVD